MAGKGTKTLFPISEKVKVPIHSRRRTGWLGLAGVDGQRRRRGGSRQSSTLSNLDSSSVRVRQSALSSFTRNDEILSLE